MRNSLFALTILALSACATGAGQLGSGQWQAVDINGSPVLGAKPVTLLLGAGGQISGNASCNSYSGSYRMSSQQGIRLDPGAVTRMLCGPPEVAEQERRYLEILRSVESFNRYGNGDMSLIAGDGRAIRFRRF